MLFSLIHVDIQQKPTQHCKAIILQLKLNKLKKKKFYRQKKRPKKAFSDCVSGKQN